MEFIQPTSWDEALAAKSAFPAGMPIAGGTDVMVELNFDRARPDAIIDLTRVAELRELGEEDGLLRIGAGVTYTRVIAELGERLPGLAMAARTVGSPQIRNRGTVGGNLGAASPAGDAHPPLVAARAEVELASSARARGASPVREFYRRAEAERARGRRADRRGPRRAGGRGRSSSRRSAPATRW